MNWVWAIFVLGHHATKDSPWSAVMADSTKQWLGWELAKNANILTHRSLTPQYQRLQGKQDVCQK